MDRLAVHVILMKGVSFQRRETYGFFSKHGRKNFRGVSGIHSVKLSNKGRKDTPESDRCFSPDV